MLAPISMAAIIFRPVTSPEQQLGFISYSVQAWEPDREEVAKNQTRRNVQILLTIMHKIALSISGAHEFPVFCDK